MPRSTRQMARQRIALAALRAFERIDEPHGPPPSDDQGPCDKFVEQRTDRIEYYRKSRYLHELLEYYEIGVAISITGLYDRDSNPYYPTLTKRDRIISTRLWRLFNKNRFALLEFYGICPSDIYYINNDQWMEVEKEVEEFWIIYSVQPEALETE